MRLRFILLSALVVFLAVYPEVSRGAGFAKHSLFLSKTSVVEGDTVLIHAIVANDTETRFSGKLSLREKENLIGTVLLTLAAEEVRAVSISWNPSAGTHTLTAELATESADIVEEQQATFSIAEKPKKPEPGSDSSQTASVQSSDQLQQQLAQLSPSVAGYTAPIFETIDSLREKAVQALDKGVEWSKNKVMQKNKSSVLGADSSTTPNAETLVEGTVQTVLLVGATVLLYLFSVLRYIVENTGIFYPALAVAFLYLLWRLYRRMRRPRY